MKKHSLLLIICMVMFPMESIGGNLGGIKGVVVDGITNKPLVNVTVEASTSTNIEDEQRYKHIKVKSSSSGSFIVNGLRGKNYYIKAIKEGYEQFNMSIGIQIPKKSNILMDEPVKLFKKNIDGLSKKAGTIYDKDTNVEWAMISDKRASNKKDALISIDSYNAIGKHAKNDWRLPTLLEAKSICYKTSNYRQRINQAINNKWGLNNRDVLNMLDVSFQGKPRYANNDYHSIMLEDGKSLILDEDRGGRSCIVAGHNGSAYVWPMRGGKAPIINTNMDVPVPPVEANNLNKTIKVVVGNKQTSDNINSINGPDNNIHINKDFGLLENIKFNGDFTEVIILKNNNVKDNYWCKGKCYNNLDSVFNKKVIVTWEQCDDDQCPLEKAAINIVPSE